MNSGMRDLPELPALKYLQDIEALTLEIKTGMDAVGANALSAFEQSVAKQQELCTSLSRLTGPMRAGYEMENVPLSMSAGLFDHALGARIGVAVELLLDLNAQYAALIRHSGESARLFAGLCQSYKGPFQPLHTGGVHRPGWSFQS